MSVLERVLVRIDEIRREQRNLLLERESLDIFVDIYHRYEIAEEPSHASSSAGAAAEPEIERAPPALKEQLDAIVDNALATPLGLTEWSKTAQDALGIVEVEPGVYFNNATGTLVDTLSDEEETYFENDEAAAFFRSLSDNTDTPETEHDAGGFDSRSLTEISVKPQVQVLPVVGDDKGGPTGMGRSDIGERSDQGEGGNETPLSPEVSPETGIVEPEGDGHASSGFVDYSVGVPMAPMKTVPSVETSTAPLVTDAADLAANDGGDDVVPPATEEVVATISSRPREVRSKKAKDRMLERMSALYKNAPEMSLTEVASELNISRIKAGDFARELGLVWSKTAAGPVPAAAATGEVGHAASPAATVVPFVPRKFGSGTVVHTPMKRASRKTMFRLTDGDGRYLHQSCLSMVQGTKNAWQGTEDQLLACRRKFLLAQDLKERKVEKE